MKLGRAPAMTSIRGPVVLIVRIPCFVGFGRSRTGMLGLPAFVQPTGFLAKRVLELRINW